MSRKRPGRASIGLNPTPFFSPWARLPRIAVALALLALLLCGPAPWARAQQEKEEEPPPPLPELMVALMHDAVEEQAAAMTLLRREPEVARSMLTEALQRESLPPGWWRLVVRLAEFGAAEDIPILLAVWRREGLEPAEREVITATLRTLYDPPGAGPSLEGMVTDFSFIQTEAPEPVSVRHAGRWMLSDRSFAELHRSEVPIRLIRRLRYLRNVPYREREELEEALLKQLGKRIMAEHGPTLLAAATRVAERNRVAGLARVRLYNPLERPLLLRISLNAWFAQFSGDPVSELIYLEAGLEGAQDLPITLEGDGGRPEVRLDLRLSHFNGAPIQVFQKLYLTLQP